MEKEDTQPINAVPTDTFVIRMLLDQRKKLLAEVNQIDRMLKREGIEVDNASLQGGPSAITQSGRPRNMITKVNALLQVLKSASQPLSQRELVLGIQNLGYVFSSQHPSNTLNPLLYGDKKLSSIKKLATGFVLAEREKEFSQSESPS
jgi:hypothetical protein